MLSPTARAYRRLELASACVALLLVSTLGVTVGSSPPVAGPAVWQAGTAVPVAVHEGRARFTLPTGPALVIVSPLARGPGTFPLRLTARVVAHSPGADLEIEPAGQRARPRLAPPKLPPVSGLATALPPRERSFHLMTRDGDVASASNYLAVPGVLRAVGRRVQVYVDASDLENVGPEVLTDLVATFDDHVFPVAAATFGQARDVDGDGRFTVFMSSWLTRLAGGRHAVDGFVRGADLDPAIPGPFSNHCDMMYLSTALGPGPHLRTVLAHEYTHAVTFCAKTLVAPGHEPPGPEEEGWLDEALAHLAEDLHGFSRSNLDYRISAFLSQPERYRLVVDDYYAADLFRSHGNRGGTYLFLRWCADRFGPGLLPALIASDQRGVANIEAVTGVPFADLYRAWTLALFRAGFDPSSRRADSFRSIDLRGPYDAWSLAGPRTVSVWPDGVPLEWNSAGTASRYLIVEPAPAGTVEVDVSSPVDARLQVTVLPLPADLPRMVLAVSAGTGPRGEPALSARVEETAGQPVRLSSLSWEPLVPGPDPHAPTFRHDGLDNAGIAAACGTATLPARGRLATRPIPAATAVQPGTALVVKAVGTDAHGRRVSAWAVLDPPIRGTLAGPIRSGSQSTDRR